MRIPIADTEAMEAFGRDLARELAAGDLLVLTGPLGAGKTTLTRGLGDGLGVRGPVQSPTFVLARTHPSLVGGAPLVHVDAYRLGSAAELEDLDLDFARSVVVVEWGAGLLDGVSESWLEIVIERRAGGDRVGAEASGGARGSRRNHDAARDEADLDAALDDAADLDADLDDADLVDADLDDADLDADLDDADLVDADLDDADLDADEPRTITVTGHGPRWAGTRFAPRP